MKQTLAAGRLQDNVKTWELPRNLHSPALARQLAEQTAIAWGTDPDGDCTANLAICVSEAVTNAVTHGAGTVLMTLERAGGTITGRVRDDGRWQPTAENDGEHGYGLGIVATLAEVFEVTRGDAGTTVMFRIPVPALPARAAA